MKCIPSPNIPLSFNAPVMLAAAFLLCISPMAGAVETVTIEPFRDNTIYSENNNSNGQGVHLFAGRVGALGGGAVRRALMMFDPAGAIPAGSTIESVTLTMRVDMTVTAAQSSALHRVLREWCEGASNAGVPGGQGAPPAPDDATWNFAFYNTIAWERPGGDFVDAPSATASVGSPGAYTWSSEGMVEDVQHWLDNPGESFGWILIIDESRTSAKRFHSRQASDPNVRPRLTITYSQVDNPFADLADAGDGWKESPWMGFLHDQFYPWIYHAQHQWMFVFNAGGGNLFLYDASSATWWFTSEGNYPFIYNYGRGSWTFYNRGSSNPRRFTDLDTSEEFELNP